MNPRVMRIFIPLVAAGLATLVVLSMLMSKPSPTGGGSGTASTQASAPATQSGGVTVSSGTPTTAASTAPAESIAGLHAVAIPTSAAAPPAQPLGSIDPRISLMRLEFTRHGAGITTIAFSDLWETAAAKRKALAYEKTRPPGAPLETAKLDESKRYILQTAHPYRWMSADGKPQSISVPVLGAHSIILNGTSIPLLNDSIWSETGPGMFVATIADGENRPVAQITRQYFLGANYDITLRQQVQNLSAQPLDIRWRQYGPIELRKGESDYIDNRRFNVGYFPDLQRRPDLIMANNSDLTVERADSNKRVQKSHDLSIPAREREQALMVWPNPTLASKGNNSLALSWFGSTNRYFGMTIHPLLDAAGNGDRVIESTIQDIRLTASEYQFDPNNDPVFTFLTSPNRLIPAGEATSIDFGMYGGPLDRHLLSEQQPYRALAMSEMILYRMSSCCGFLTFQWLAHLLLGFLTMLHDYVVFDWGIAIILLVCVVRTLLHPITKRSQVHMQRMGKQMASLKPEIEKLQKRYPNDPKKMQQEQMRLMHERGVNPLKMVGYLTMFLQTPIWIALWAMLYLAFDLRQQPAFYGVFQMFNNWSFLGDLSSPDHFIPLGQGTKLPLLGLLNAINLMPILLGVVFFIQQKYMTPPSATPLTPEQEQQQKITKVMMVVMMPLMMYGAPSGLTLYMFTSSCIGILESKYIRRHVTEMDLNPQPEREKTKPRGKARAWAEALERARERARQKSQEPPKRFKERK